MGAELDLDARDAEIVRLYMEGRPLAEIGARFGLSITGVSSVAKRRGCPRRPSGQPPKYDPAITKFCEQCGGPFRLGEGAERERAERPSEFAMRRFCSKDCRRAYIKVQAVKRIGARAWVVGRRTLLAKTCPACGELLPADRFQRQARGYYATNCWRCNQRGWMASMPEEDRRAVQLTRQAAAKRANDEARDTAHRWGYLWTGPELELLGRKDLTAPQLAAMLGRTPEAVNTQRQKLRKGDPMKTHVAGVTKSKDPS